MLKYHFTQTEPASSTNAQSLRFASLGKRDLDVDSVLPPARSVKLLKYLVPHEFIGICDIEVLLQKVYKKGYSDGSNLTVHLIIVDKDTNKPHTMRFVEDLPSKYY